MLGNRAPMKLIVPVLTNWPTGPPEASEIASSPLPPFTKLMAPALKLNPRPWTMAWLWSLSTAMTEPDGRPVLLRTKRGVPPPVFLTHRVRPLARTEDAVTVPASMKATSPEAGTPAGLQAAAFSNAPVDLFQFLVVITFTQQSVT